MKLGIDFGTTNTVAAFADRGNYPVVAFDGATAIPSVIAVRRADAALCFGEAAVAVARDPKWALLRSFKRLLADAGPLTEVVVGGHPFKIADLLTSFLGHVREELTARSNAGLKKGEPLQAAVSVPANASSAQRFLTMDAFGRAGFEVNALLNEPSAAGFEYAHRFSTTLTSKREHVVVYDLGGGTFDASLIHLAGHASRVVASAGVSRLGGDDFDGAIAELVIARAGLGTLSEAQRSALLDECRGAKDGISPNSRRLTVDLTAFDKPPLVLPIDEVFAATLALVTRSIEAMEPVIARDGVGWSEVAGIYAVGGASGFPLVPRLLRERFGEHRVKRSAHPFAAAAIGLAIFLDEGAGYELSDCLTRHFGVFRESARGAEVRFDPIFPKDSRVPSKGEPPLEAVRRYRAAHNVGHFRFVECGDLKDGRPDGDVAPWDEIRFAFEPGLRARGDLQNVAVQRLAHDGPVVEERYRCTAAGTLEVALTVLDDGYTRTFKVAGRAAS
ncbi:MAG: DnaK family protein [Myxococcaceae bacterium]|nr:DnaK family protein [Myxococcaceae bacterium]